MPLEDLLACETLLVLSIRIDVQQLGASVLTRLLLHIDRYVQSPAGASRARSIGEVIQHTHCNNTADNMGSYISSLTKKPSTEKMSSSPLAFKHYAKAQSTFKPPLIANGNAFLGDIFSRYGTSHLIHTDSLGCSLTSYCNLQRESRSRSSHFLRSLSSRTRRPSRLYLYIP